jgi:hypothetical protein
LERGAACSRFFAPRLVARLLKENSLNAGRESAASAAFIHEEQMEVDVTAEAKDKPINRLVALTVVVFRW